MPVASKMTTAAYIYRRTEGAFAKSIEGLTGEEWHRRPNETSNSVLWIAGHCTWARSRVLAFLGSSWERPWLPLFARGSKPIETPEYPSPEELVLAWKEVSALMTAALEEASDGVLAAASPANAPSFDGTIGGLVDFLAFHEAYHAGQLAYLRRWLGHEGVAG